MAEGGAGQDDRTEAATPRRLQQARESGQVALSRELGGFAGLAAFALMLALVAPALATRFVARLAVPFRHPQLAPAAAVRLLADAAAALLAPLLGAVLLAGALSVLLQTGFLVSAASLRPSLARLSPGAGLRRLFGADSLVEAIKALLRLAAMAVALWHALSGEWPRLWAAPFQDPRAMVPLLAALALRVLLALLLVQGAIALADILWVRRRHAQGLRMSRQELREEQKDLDGDPKIKARIRQLRFQRARRRMLAAVPRATVVVTNPTHYAVALAYDRARGGAPRVVAKGVDAMAARIRETAEAHGVPLVADPPLARALHRLELDTEIPPEHYKAVAELIAYVWRLRAPRRAAA